MMGERGRGKREGEKKCQKAISTADTVLFKRKKRTRKEDQFLIPGAVRAVSRGDPVRPAPSPVYRFNTTVLFQLLLTQRIL